MLKVTSLTEPDIIERIRIVACQVSPVKSLSSCSAAVLTERWPASQFSNSIVMDLIHIANRWFRLFWWLELESSRNFCTSQCVEHSRWHYSIFYRNLSKKTTGYILGCKDLDWWKLSFSWHT